MIIELIGGPFDGEKAELKPQNVVHTGRVTIFRSYRQTDRVRSIYRQRLTELEAWLHADGVVRFDHMGYEICHNMDLPAATHVRRTNATS